MTTQADCSVGLKKETTFGTVVTPDHFPEFLDENFEWDPTFTQSKGLRVGSRVNRAGRRTLTKEQSKGDLTVELATKGMGIFFEAALGVATSTLISGSAYQEVFTPTLTDLLNSYTIQKGIPPYGGGATQPITFNGAVCGGFELTVPNGGLLTLKTDWIARALDTSTAYAAPSYPSGVDVFSFAGGTINIGGTVTKPTATALATGGTAVANINDFSLSWDNQLADNGFSLGGAGKRVRKPAVGMGDLGKGKFTAEYTDNTLRDAYLAQTDLCALLNFTTPTIISGAINPTLQVYIPDIRLNGDLPNANGGDIIVQDIDFDVLDPAISGTAPLYIVLITADTAV